MSGFHLPAPWSAPEQERMCGNCGRPTRHFGRRVSTAFDEESDRVIAEVAWFCNECGHRTDIVHDASPAPPEPGDDLTELFDRH